MFDSLIQEANELKASFEAKLAEFLGARNSLQAKAQAGQIPEPMRAEAAQLLADSSTWERMATEARDALNKIWSWLSGLFGDSEGVQGLGFLPVLPLALVGVITACVAGMTKWILDYAEFNKRLDVYNGQISRGVSPTKAADIINSPSSSLIGGVEIDLKTVLLLGGLLFGGLYLLKKVRT